MLIFRIVINVEESNALLVKVERNNSSHHYDQPDSGLYGHNRNSFEDLENGNITAVPFMDETTSLSQNSILIPLTGTSPPQHDEPFDTNTCEYLIYIYDVFIILSIIIVYFKNN